MATQRLAPDAVLVSTNYTTLNLTDIDEDPDSSDGVFGTWDGNGNTVCLVSFPTPSGNPTAGAGLQEFRVLIRRNGATTATNWSLALYENGSAVGAALATGTLSNTTPVVVSGTWNASSLGTADGSLVECRLTQTSGGTGGTRSGVEVGAVEWNATYTPSFTSNAAKLRAQSGSFTVGAVIRKADIPGSFSGDAARRVTQSGSLSANATIFATVARTLTSNAIAAKFGIGGTFALNAIRLEARSGSFSCSAVIFSTVSRSWTIDGVRFGTQSGSIAADSFVQPWFLVQYQWVIGYTTVENAFAANAFVQPWFTINWQWAGVTVVGSFKIDARVRPYFTANAIRLRTIVGGPELAENTSSPSGNVLVVTGTTETVLPGCDLTVATDGPITVNWDIWTSQNAYGVHKYATVRLRRTNTTGEILYTYSWEGWADNASGHVEHFASSYVDNAPTDGRYVWTFQSTSGYSGTQVYSDTRTFTLSGQRNIGFSVDARTPGGTNYWDFSASAVIFKTQTRTFTASARLHRHVSTLYLFENRDLSGSLTVESDNLYLFENRDIAHSTTVDARALFQFENLSRGGGFALYSRFTGPPFYVYSFSADAWIVGTLGEFTIDAELSGVERSRSFTVDAVQWVPGTQLALFSIDAAFMRGRFRIDAWIRASFTIDARKIGTTKTFTIDWLWCQAGSFTVDAIVRRTMTGTVYNIQTDGHVEFTDHWYGGGWYAPTNRLLRYIIVGGDDFWLTWGNWWGAATWRSLGSPNIDFLAYSSNPGPTYPYSWWKSASIRPSVFMVLDPSSSPTLFTIDALKARGKFFISAAKSQFGVSRQFPINAWKNLGGSSSFTLNAVIQGVSTFSVDAVFHPIDGGVPQVGLVILSFNVDAYIKGTPIIVFDEDGDPQVPVDENDNPIVPSRRFRVSIYIGVRHPELFDFSQATYWYNAVTSIQTDVNTYLRVQHRSVAQQRALEIDQRTLDIDKRRYRQATECPVTWTEYTGHIVWAQTTFTQQAKVSPGSFQIVMRGAFPELNGGEEVRVEVDDFRVFGGYVTRVDQGYFFDAVTEPRTTLYGVDYNGLFDKLVTYNRPSMWETYHRTSRNFGAFMNWRSFPKGTSDRKIVIDVAKNFVDIPFGFDYSTFVDAVDTPAPVTNWMMPEPGQIWRLTMQSISQITSAVWWIDPYLNLHYHDRGQLTPNRPAITDGAGGVSSRNLVVSSDINQMVTEDIVWGTLAKTIDGKVVYDHEIADGLQAVRFWTNAVNRIARYVSTYQAIPAADRTDEQSADLATDLKTLAYDKAQLQYAKEHLSPNLLAQYGRWQYAEFRSDIHDQEWVDRRAQAIVTRYSHPIIRAEATVWEAGYQAGQVVTVKSNAYGIEANLVIRQMTISFAVSQGMFEGRYYAIPRYDLVMGLDPEEPWNIYDYLPLEGFNVSGDR